MGFAKPLKFNLHLENKNTVQHSPLGDFSCHAGTFSEVVIKYSGAVHTQFLV